jgi:hypothetical protein
MSAELRRLQEQRDAFVALAEALGTQDGWLSYRAEALRDQLLEHEGQATARPPPPSSGSAQPSSIGMRRCSRRGGIWSGCAPWRPTGRQRLMPIPGTIKSK